MTHTDNKSNISKATKNILMPFKLSLYLLLLQGVYSMKAYVSVNAAEAL